jgi:hypothetical protein
VQHLNMSALIIAERTCTLSTVAGLPASLVGAPSPPCMPSAAVAEAEAATCALALAHEASTSIFRISVVAMSGATIVIDDASAADTILSVKERIFVLNRKLPVHRQRLIYRPGSLGTEPLADDKTLGGAGVAQDGSANLDVLLAELTEAQATEVGERMLEAARNGLMDDMLDLLDQGANIEFRNRLIGRTALM